MVGELLPHLSGSPVLACFGLSDTPKLRSAVKAVLKKYPNITLVCFDRECYDRLHDMDITNLAHYPFMQKETIRDYNVIGALVGVDYQGDTFGLKEMMV